MPRLARRRAVLLTTAALLGCGAGAGPQETFPEPVILQIEFGASSQQIATTLESRGVIDSKWAFLWERAWNRDARLLAGEYAFERPVAAAEAFRMISEGRVRLYSVTVPEGLNRFQAAEAVARSGMVDREEFLALTADPTPVKDFLPKAETLEGVLFPDTYSLSQTSTAQDLVEAMISQFRTTLAEAWRRRTAEMEHWDALVLASMIEKEAVDRTEAGLVSSVFHNRIRRGMLMQCDPTIIYGLVLEGRYRGRIYRSDLADPHPYNTYVHGGLPPGPIASPGRDALRAAFSPDKSDFLYFVAKPGFRVGHVFSKTLGAHSRGVRAWRRYERTLR